MAVYNQVFAYFNGALMSENTSVDISMDGDDQPVLTTVKGFAGITPSPKMITAQLENVVPPSGFEHDVFQKELDSEEVEMKFQLGTGQQLTSKGFISGVKVGAGVGKTMALSFSFRGAPAIFQ